MERIRFRRLQDYSVTENFGAPLTSTLSLSYGAGNPTFTRATTATVTDFEGLVKTVKSGEARFEGARRVENLATYSELLSNAAWVNYINGFTKTAGFSDPDGGLNAWKLDNNGVASSGITRSQGVAGETYTVSVWLKADSGTPTVMLGTNDTNYVAKTLSTTWKRYSYTGVKDVYGRNFHVSVVGATSTIIYMYHPQVENVTGQANQNPSEYVSTNVLSAPYHGANVDGVKYFTTQNGNTVASNVVTEATGAAIPDATLHGYLAEGARTNLETYSEDMSNWSVFRVTVGTDVSVSPSGATTADSLIETSGSGTHAITRNFSVTSGTVYTLSAYIKPSGRTWVRIDGGLLLSPYANFNLSGSGSIGTITATSATITNVGGGWYRCTVTSTASGTGSTAFEIYAETGDEGYSYVGTNSLTALYVWGAQLETGAFASSYIPTTSASVTRNADNLNYPVAGNLDSTKGTSYAEAKFKADKMMILSTWNGSSGGEPMYIGSGDYKLTLWDGASRSLSSAFSTPVETLVKIATSWGGSKSSGAVNGVLTSAGFDGSMNFNTTLYIGRESADYYLFGTIRNVKIWKKALTDSKLISLTT